jgi:CubicO group peptidase (beta-lactamase class C family)
MLKFRLERVDFLASSDGFGADSGSRGIVPAAVRGGNRKQFWRSVDAFCYYRMCLLMLANRTSHRGSGTITTVETALETIRVAEHCPALGICVARADARYVEVVGERAIGTGIPVTKNDLWHLGSIGKSMTATLFARLVDSGYISWETSPTRVLSHLLPIPLQPAYYEINLLHLLSHQSGLVRDVAYPDISDRQRYPSSRTLYAAAALSSPLVGRPGKGFNYSNAGYVVAAAMLEVLLDSSWEALIQEHLFAPLGLVTAGFGPPDTGQFLAQPAGHYRQSTGDALVWEPSYSINCLGRHSHGTRRK